MPKPSFNLLIVYILTLLIMGCSTDIKHSASNNSPAKMPVQDMAYEITVVTSGEGWGYQIKHNNTVVINQLTIPAIGGHHPFVSEAEARATAALVIDKLSHGRMPPSVTTAELDSLGITY